VRAERLQSYSLALVAAALWATLGLFYRRLEELGLSLLTIVFYRAALTAVILFVVLGWRRRAWLCLRWRACFLFAALGLLGVAAFFVVYIYAIALTGMGMAAVLMYTAPAWVTLLGAFFFQERLGGSKIVAVSLVCMGCALVGQVYDLASVRLNLLGILAGLGAGLTYGLYTLFSKVAQRRHTSWATLAYALGWGAVFMLPLQLPSDLVRAAAPDTLFWLLMLALVPTLGGGVAFNAALRRIPASSASIVATLEPVIATLLGWAFFDEQLEALQLVGAGLVIIGVLLLKPLGAHSSVGGGKNG